MNSHLTARIADARFRPTRLREGYDLREVDELLDRLSARLGRGEPVADTIRAARLTRGRWREGYLVEDVDRFLSELGREPVTPRPSPYDAPAD